VELNINVYILTILMNFHNFILSIFSYISIQIYLCR